MRHLRTEIADLSTGLDRLANEQRDVRSATSAREQFLDEHARGVASIGAVDEEIDNHLVSRAGAALDNPTDDHLEALGPVPAETQDQGIWAEGAIILERRRLGLDDDRKEQAQTAMDRSRRRESAEPHATRVAAVIPLEPEPASPALDVGLDLDLS